MEEKVIEYMPKRVYSYFSILWLIFAFVEAILMIMCMISRNRDMALVFLLFLCACVVLMVLFYHNSKLKILFTQDAIYVKQNKCKESSVYYYADYLYAYYCRDYKARLYLVLSTERKMFKNIKKITNHASCLERTVVGKCVVIFLDNSKNREQIKELIGEKVLNVYNE